MVKNGLNEVNLAYFISSKKERETDAEIVANTVGQFSPFQAPVHFSTYSSPGAGFFPAFPYTQRNDGTSRLAYPRKGVE
jgi:hypothetical protein